jgi:branched-chain amino acid transport system ATP-binding protein
VADLRVGYGDGPDVLSGFDLTVDAGELVVIFGENGAGKTTLVRSLAGLLGFHGGEQRAGSIFVLGESDGRGAVGRHRCGLATVLAGRRLFLPLTVEKNLELAVGSRSAAGRRSRRDRRRAVATAFEVFPALAHRRSTPAGRLSGGEQQMVALARALIIEPGVLVLDEATVGLAPAAVDHLAGALTVLRGRGTAILALEHDRTVLAGLADRVLRLERGSCHLVRTGTARPEARAADVAVGAHSAEDDRSARVLLEVEGLVLTVGGLRLLDGVDLVVGAGQTVGLVGPNGAGKSSLINCVTGFARYGHGQVRAAGATLPAGRVLHAARAGVIRSFQEPAVFASLSVEENLLVARHDSMSSSLLRNAVPLGRARRQDRQGLAEVDDVAHRLGLHDVRHELAGTLPAGVQKRVDVARALLRRPCVLLLDEPAAGLDRREVDIVADALADHRRATGGAIVLVDHDFTLIRRLCDEIVEMEGGRVIGARSLDRDEG